MIGYLYAWLWASGNLRNKPKIDDTEYEYVQIRNAKGEKVYRKRAVVSYVDPQYTYQSKPFTTLQILFCAACIIIAITLDILFVANKLNGAGIFIVLLFLISNSIMLCLIIVAMKGGFK